MQIYCVVRGILVAGAGMKLPSYIERWEVPHKASGVIHGDIPVVRESSGDYHLISVINSTGLPIGYY